MASTTTNPLVPSVRTSTVYSWQVKYAQGFKSLVKLGFDPLIQINSFGSDRRLHADWNIGGAIFRAV